MIAARLFAAAALAVALPAAGQDVQSIAVTRLERAPVVDGDLREWGTGGWTRVRLAPAVKPEERARLGLAPLDRNLAVDLVVEIKAGVSGGRIFFALRWPDGSPDTDYRLWERRGAQYVEGSQRDDALALRFALEGEFDRSMLSGKSHVADVWFWTAGRSNRAGYAEDMTHRISTRPIEYAAEYEVAGVGTVYIKKTRDAGTPIYRNIRPPEGASAERLPSIEVNPRPEGSVADVAAKGEWSDGTWRLELGRRLDTGNADDVVFRPGGRALFQIAVFNRASDDNKSVSEPLLLDLGALR
jgi:hypothetical protein